MSRQVVLWCVLPAGVLSALMRLLTIELPAFRMTVRQIGQSRELKGIGLWISLTPRLCGEFIQVNAQQLVHAGSQIFGALPGALDHLVVNGEREVHIPIIGMSKCPVKRRWLLDASSLPTCLKVAGYGRNR